MLTRGELAGQSIAALARAEGVSAQKLYWWKKRLGEEDEGSASGFVEVSLPPRRQAQAFAVEARNGRKVVVWPGFDEDELARLLAVVEEEEPC